MPKVSVVIPTYNREKVVVRAIDTVLKQTFTDYEIIVIDDGSQDATRQILGPYTGKIKYFYQDNAGISAARNRGIKESQGEYVAFLDSDDEWTPDKLALQVDILEKNKKVGLVFSKMTRLNEKGEAIGTKPENPTGSNFKELLEIGGDIPTSTVIVRRECFEKVGYFDESLTIMEDFEMWLRISEHYDIHLIDDKNLANYHHHSQQITRDKVQVYGDYIKLQKKILDYYDNKPVQLITKRIAENEYVLSRIYYDQKSYQQALSLAGSSICRFPLVGLLFINRTDSFLNKAFKIVKPYFYIVICYLRATLFSPGKTVHPMIKRKRKAPLVSIIVPVFNRVQYLEQAIDSILKQNYTDFEVIIVDDGSTENIKEALIKCTNKAPSQIRYIRQANRGPAGARNKGIKEAAGKFIAFLDADDEWETEFLNRCIERFKEGHCRWLDTGAYRIVFNDNEEVLERKAIFMDPIGETDDIYSLLLKDDIIGMPSKVIVEKECFEKAGYFREDLRIREDWEMWLRLAKAGFQYCHILEPLYQYKIRQNSLTRTESLRGLRCTYKVLSDYAQDAFKSDAGNRVRYAEKMWDIARQVSRNKDKDYLLFLKSVLKSQLYDPSLNRILKSLNSSKKEP